MTDATPSEARRGIDPRYLVVLGACLIQFTTIGLLFSYSVLIKEFETEFGWSRTLLSACQSLAFLIMGVLAIFGGRLSDLYGPRVVLLCSGVLYGVGYGLISFVTEPWHLFAIFGLFIGLGLASHDVVTLSTVARWFERRRGMMTGVVKVGTALGQMSVPPFTAFLIALLGWRDAVAALGVAAVVLLVTAALTIKPAPRKAPIGTAGSTEGMTFTQVRRSREFWTLCAVQFLFFPTLTTVPLHIVVHGTDMGLTVGVAATLLSVTAAGSVAGRLTVGTLIDRIKGRRAYIVCFVPLIASLVSLTITESPSPLFVTVAVYGFAHGGFFTVVSPAVAEYFGTKAHGTSFGAVLFFGTIGGAIGPILAGGAFDLTGSYTLAFATLAAMAAVGLALVLSLPRTGRT